jgi:hypothetical protein
MPAQIARKLALALETTSRAGDLVRLADEVPASQRADVLDHFNRDVSALKASGRKAEYRRGMFLALRLTQHLVIRDFDLPYRDLNFHIN